MRIIDMRPPRIALGLTVSAAILHWTLGTGETVHFSLPREGVVTGLAGFSLMMWSWALFKKREVAVCPKAMTTSMITDGPYRLSRNPMYLGMVLILTGLALWVGTPPFYLSATAFFLILNSVFCPFEEGKLTTTFGPEYLHYLNRVRRWI